MGRLIQEGSWGTSACPPVTPTYASLRCSLSLRFLPATRLTGSFVASGKGRSIMGGARMPVASGTPTACSAYARVMSPLKRTLSISASTASESKTGTS